MTAVCRGGHHVTVPGATSCACGDITYVPAVRDRYWQCHGDCTVDCGACKGHGRPEEAPCRYCGGYGHGGPHAYCAYEPRPPAETQQDDEHAHPALRDALCRYLDDRADYADRGSLSDDFAELWAYVAPALAARPSADTETLRRAREVLARYRDGQLWAVTALGHIGAVLDGDR